MYFCALRQLCVPTNFHSIQTNTHLTAIAISHWTQYNDTKCIERIEWTGTQWTIPIIYEFTHVKSHTQSHTLTRRISFVVIRPTTKSERDAVSRDEQ